MPDYPSNDHSAPNGSRETRFSSFRGYLLFPPFSFLFFFSSLFVFSSFCLGFVSDIGERYLTMTRTGRFDFDFLFFSFLFLFFSYLGVLVKSRLTNDSLANSS